MQRNLCRVATFRHIYSILCFCWFYVAHFLFYLWCYGCLFAYFCGLHDFCLCLQCLLRWDSFSKPFFYHLHNLLLFCPFSCYVSAALFHCAKKTSVLMINGFLQGSDRKCTNIGINWFSSRTLFPGKGNIPASTIARTS